MNPGKTDWIEFQRRFIAPEGRVIDTGNGGVSHSEGQGIGMLSAVQFDDPVMFERLASWTSANLARRTDRLHAWRYRPGAAVPVDDPNNATDGDMLIAWAMFEAGQKWNRPDLRDTGRQIAADIMRTLVRPVGGRLVLLPGAYGFEHADRVVVNPSYYVFPALHRLTQDMPHPTWARLYKDGLGLLRDARYGRWGLPPDWLAVPRSGARPEIAEGWPARFSFDAVRVPLYLAWAGLGTEPAVESACEFWGSFSGQGAPAWTDLRSNALAPYGQSCGLRAIQTFSAATRENREDQAPSAAGAQDYYAAALTMLVHVARATRDRYASPVV